jgi:SAM-dependent methyltransferase
MYPDTCLLCGSRARETVLAFDRPDQYELAVGVSEQDYARSWEQCGACGLHYSRYSRPPGLIDRIYEDAYRDAHSPWRGETVRDTFRRVIALPAGQSETKARVKWIKERIAALGAAGFAVTRPAPWRLLDVGGASGVFAYEFADAEWQAEVMDPSAAGRFLSEEYRIRYHERPFGPGVVEPVYDLISFVYTLEHLADPLEALRVARDGLRSGGVVFIEVPDALAFRVTPADDDIFNACHLWMFDPVTLGTALAACGLELFALERIRPVRGHCGLMALAGLERVAGA